MRQRPTPTKTKWIDAAAASVIIGLALAGCTTTKGSGHSNDQPSWVDRPQSVQNKGELVGVGSGSSRTLAIDAALARLAQSIEVRVVSIEQSVTVGDALQTNDAHTSSAGSSLHRTIKLLTDQRLAGVRIRQTWFDQRRGETFALAALNVRDAGQWLDSHVEQAIQRANDSLTHSESTHSAWGRLKSLRAARRDIEEALDAALGRDAIDPAAVSFNSVSSLRTLRRQIDAKLRKAQIAFPIGVVAQSTLGEPVAAAVLQAVGANRVDGVAPTASKALVKIQCDLTLERVVSYDPATLAMRWTTTVIAVDVQSRRVIDTLRLTGVELSREDVRRAAALSAVRQITQEIPGFLDRIFDDR